jgi:hypothetical protein
MVYIHPAKQKPNREQRLPHTIGETKTQHLKPPGKFNFCTGSECTSVSSAKRKLGPWVPTSALPVIRQKQCSKRGFEQLSPLSINRKHLNEADIIRRTRGGARNDGAFGEFERALLRERQREGIALAKKKGAYKGRKPSLTPEQIRELHERIASGEKKAVLAHEFGISRETLYQIRASHCACDIRNRGIARQ